MKGLPYGRPFLFRMQSATTDQKSELFSGFIIYTPHPEIIQWEFRIFVKNS